LEEEKKEKENERKNEEVFIYNPEIFQKSQEESYNRNVLKREGNQFEEERKEELKKGQRGIKDRLFNRESFSLEDEVSLAGGEKFGDNYKNRKISFELVNGKNYSESNQKPIYIISHG
jgi:hypothetical protein